jgi:formamidopyrimidine-DNA glycosylase
MPELPEVETIVRGLARAVVGDVIDSVWIGERPQPLKSPAQEIAAVLEGARIESVRRMGKHIVFDLRRPSSSSPHKMKRGRPSAGRRRVLSSDRGSPTRAHFIVHLGMTGRLLVGPPDLPLAKHTHFVARLASGDELRFLDPRMFGRLAVVRDGFNPAGSEPLDVEFPPFVALFRGRKTPIKSALLSQKLLRGVGNIYADESLARSGIRPRRRAASLTRAELQRLYQALRQVLQEAIDAGGSSVSNYVDARGEPGFFQLQHRVYGREAEPCLVCQTPIKRIVIAGRSSHYCPKCQK